MAMTINGKYMVLIQTTTQPVNITPMLSRFSKITKALTFNEIGACLAANAKVTLLASDRNIVLTKTNYREQLAAYRSSLDARYETTKASVESAKNEQILNNLVATETATPAAEPTRAAAPAEEEAPIGEAGETAQVDPEDPDNYPDEVFYQE
jgi:hypothetical protein